MRGGRWIPSLPDSSDCLKSWSLNTTAVYMARVGKTSYNMITYFTQSLALGEVGEIFLSLTLSVLRGGMDSEERNNRIIQIITGTPSPSL